MTVFRKIPSRLIMFRVAMRSVKYGLEIYISYATLPDLIEIYNHKTGGMGGEIYI